jgi:hypothetical protein
MDLAQKGAVSAGDRLCRQAHDAGAILVIPRRRNRKRAIRYDQQRYAGRHLI